MSRETRRRGRRAEHVGVLELDAEEMRNVAYALGLRDLGAMDLLDFADHLDDLNGVATEGTMS